MARSDRAAAIGLITLIAVLGLLLFVWPLTLDVPLLDPDEGLHASIAQEMLERGERVKPTFLGRAFVDKPVLFFWTQMASLQVLGQTEAGVRLPGLLFGALGALATGLLARELFGGTTGMIAGAIHATMLAPLAQSQAGVHDVVLVPWTTLALLFLRRADVAVSRLAAVRSLLAAALFLGLAMLTKGLAGVALVVLAAGAMLVVSRRLTLVRLLCVAGCVGVGAIVAAPWYLAMEGAQPGYLHYYFVERHLLGYATGSTRHGGRPWWYYAPILLAGGLPWTVYLAAAARDWWRTNADALTADALTAAASTADTSPAAAAAVSWAWVWAWLCSGLIFLSVGQVKLWTYVLPLFPAIAMLTARPWARAIASGPAACRSTTWAVTVHVLLGSILLPVAWVFTAVHYGRSPSPSLYFCVAAIAAGYGAAWIAFARGAPRAAFVTLLSMLVATAMATLALLMPPVAEAISARDLARHFNRVGAMPPRLLVVDERVGSLVFYLKPEIRRGLTDARLASVAMVFAPAEIADAPPDTVIAVREGRAGRFTGVIAPCQAPYERAGEFRLYRAAKLRRRPGLDGHPACVRS